MWFTRIGLLSACAAVVAATAAADSPVRLPEGIATAAEEVVKFITAQGYDTVGVLKFRVRKPGGDAGETPGTINRDVTGQLETALVLKRKQGADFLLVAGTSDTAAAIDGASDVTEAGRAKLFAGRYRPAWGDRPQPVAVDAFVTGVIDVSAAYDTMRVSILAFDRGAAPREVVAFDAAVEPALLAPLGESFQARGLLGGGWPVVPRTEQGPPRVKPPPATLSGFKPPDRHPLEEADCPAVLEVAYDGVAVPLEFRAGKASVREPREGQKVEFTVRKRNRDGRRIGVVLKVNGENTAMRERAPDLRCYKWILSDANPTVLIRGYQTDRRTVVPFTVLSTAASRSRAFDYGSDVGTISLTVFEDETSAPPQAAGPAERPDVALLDRGAGIDSVAAQATPQQLRELLLGTSGSAARGLIVEGGGTEKRAIDLVDFSPLPTPAMAAVVTYYDPAAKDAP